MALNVEDGQKMLQLISSRYNDWRWRKKIEKTLSLPQSGVGDEKQRAIFFYFKTNLKAYKSFRADPDSWMVGGFATKQVVDRLKASPTVVHRDFQQEDTAYLGTDPGADVTESWWEEMLVAWFDQPEDETSEEAGEAQAEGTDAAAAASSAEGAGETRRA